MGRTMCIDYGTERREKEKDSRYIQEASAPAAVTVYQICNISLAQSTPVIASVACVLGS
jgi:hypothetical protein